MDQADTGAVEEGNGAMSSLHILSMDLSTGVYSKLRKKRFIFLLSMLTLASAVRAVSLVSSGSFPVKNDFNASHLHTSDERKGVTLRCGGFFLN